MRWRVSEWLRCVLLLLLAAYVVPDGTTWAQACESPSSLRVVVVQIDGSPSAEAQAKYNFVMNASRRLLLDLRGDIAPADPDFDYLRQLRAERVSGDIMTGLSRMGIYWRSERTDVLQIVGTTVAVDKVNGETRVTYTNEMYLGENCGLRDCYFNEEMHVPPKAFESLIPDYLRVLTLYALGIDAVRAACPNKIGRAFFDGALRTIADIERRNLRFGRMPEIKAALNAQMTRLAAQS